MSPEKGPTVSGVSPASVLSVYGIRYLAAMAANRHSACGQIAPDKPIGATPKGALNDWPNNVVSIFGSNDPLSKRGNSVILANPSRFLCTQSSSPVPPSRKAQMLRGTRQRARARKSEIVG